MTTWGEFEVAEPELAGQVRRLLEGGRHKTIATLRADGSPRISGIECELVDGQLRFGSMDGARKLADLQRDPRFHLHGPTVHPVEGEEAAWPGEVKVAGRALADGPALTSEDGEPEGASFTADITEVAYTHLDPEATKLIVEWWTPTGGRQLVERA